jgi:hypothetical protein
MVVAAVASKTEIAERLNIVVSCELPGEGLLNFLLHGCRALRTLHGVLLDIKLKTAQYLPMAKQENRYSCCQHTLEIQLL